MIVKLDKMTFNIVLTFINDLFNSAFAFINDPSKKVVIIMKMAFIIFKNTLHVSCHLIAITVI